MLGEAPLPGRVETWKLRFSGQGQTATSALILLVPLRTWPAFRQLACSRGPPPYRPITRSLVAGPVFLLSILSFRFISRQLDQRIDIRPAIEKVPLHLRFLYHLLTSMTHTARLHYEIPMQRSRPFFCKVNPISRLVGSGWARARVTARLEATGTEGGPMTWVMMMMLPA